MKNTSLKIENVVSLVLKCLHGTQYTVKTYLSNMEDEVVGPKDETPDPWDTIYDEHENSEFNFGVEIPPTSRNALVEFLNTKVGTPEELGVGTGNLIWKFGRKGKGWVRVSKYSDDRWDVDAVYYYDRV